eukprot:2254550-Pyramimonas_sp.AAC.1
MAPAGRTARRHWAHLPLPLWACRWPGYLSLLQDREAGGRLQQDLGFADDLLGLVDVRHLLQQQHVRAA